MRKISEAAKKSRAKYMREYRKKNPERIREISCKYWEKRAEKEDDKNGKTEADNANN